MTMKMTRQPVAMITISVLRTWLSQPASCPAIWLITSSHSPSLSHEPPRNRESPASFLFNHHGAFAELPGVDLRWAQNGPQTGDGSERCLSA
jgi:hypothetical protein